jgi:hypothetical protein
MSLWHLLLLYRFRSSKDYDLFASDLETARVDQSKLITLSDVVNDLPNAAL